MWLLYFKVRKSARIVPCAFFICSSGIRRLSKDLLVDPSRDGKVVVRLDHIEHLTDSADRNGLLTIAECDIGIDVGLHHHDVGTIRKRCLQAGEYPGEFPSHVRGVEAHRCPRSLVDLGDPTVVRMESMRIVCVVLLQATNAENQILIPLLLRSLNIEGTVFVPGHRPMQDEVGSIEELRDVDHIDAVLEHHREIVLASQHFEEILITDVARTDPKDDIALVAGLLLHQTDDGKLLGTGDFGPHRLDARLASGGEQDSETLFSHTTKTCSTRTWLPAATTNVFDAQVCQTLHRIRRQEIDRTRSDDRKNRLVRSDLRASNHERVSASAATCDGNLRRCDAKDLSDSGHLIELVLGNAPAGDLVVAQIDLHGSEFTPFLDFDLRSQPKLLGSLADFSDFDVNILDARPHVNDHAA